VTDRIAKVRRETKETSVVIELSLDGGESLISTGIGFFDHMLIALSKHAHLGLVVDAKGDLEVDAHHTVEDVGLLFGEALDTALGDRAGIGRFGFAYAPLDEALARAVVDLSGRPFCRFETPRELAFAWITPQFPVSLVGEFWRAVASRGKFTFHLDVERAVDPHHAAEACFKAAALALCQALALTGLDVPSTKGTLSV
jgi:imidazoleglycerol-phosphate dehydratase